MGGTSSSIKTFDILHRFSVYGPRGHDAPDGYRIGAESWPVSKKRRPLPDGVRHDATVNRMNWENTKTRSGIGNGDQR